ncbi:hypothetical protein M0L20_18690 [Spirosoma sp. RP8]|uniref:DUF3575 domain-containing protein n=1 Tax=Spirosoma liriopis TaxID=2937440 RepID=A0ABT0HP47_9BACT|nr:hypothetical protein [Spirosoma liriopis]MCK8493902.1 hypothetical protein [Spirosoma liriopis]
MKKSILSFLLFTICNVSFAQYQMPSKSFRVAIEANHVGGNASGQAKAVKYSYIYSEQIKLSRWDYEISVGYINYYRKEKFSPFDYYYKGNHSQRVVGDASILYSILKKERHAFRIGLGPSVWYQRNGDVTNLSATTNGQQIENLTFNREYSSEFNVGANLKTDYEYLITPKLIVGLRAGVTTNFLTPDARASLLGTLSSVGVSVGYRF